MNTSPVVFSGTGKIQTYIVPTSGYYHLVAAGAQGGPGGEFGGKGARIQGNFLLLKDEIIHLVVGMQGGAGTMPQNTDSGGGGGGTFIWKGAVPLPLPAKPLLVAGGGGGGTHGRDGTMTMDGTDDGQVGGRCGYGGSSDFTDFHYSGGGGTGWRSGGATGSAPTYCYGGLRWTGGAGAHYLGHKGGHGGFGGGGGGGFSGGGGGGYSGGGGGTISGPSGGGGGGSYNAGSNQYNTPGIQRGDGEAIITLLAVAWPVSRDENNSLYAPMAEEKFAELPLRSEWRAPEPKREPPGTFNRPPTNEGANHMPFASRSQFPSIGFLNPYLRYGGI